jgi:hypothetical protein
MGNVVKLAGLSPGWSDWLAGWPLWTLDMYLPNGHSSCPGHLDNVPSQSGSEKFGRDIVDTVLHTRTGMLT